MTGPACPAWCQLWPGHGAGGFPDDGGGEPSGLGGVVRVAGARFVVDVCVWESADGRPARPYAWLATPVEELTAAELRSVAGLFVQVADRLERLSAEETNAARRRGLSVVGGAR